MGAESGVGYWVAWIHSFISGVKSECQGKKYHTFKIYLKSLWQKVTWIAIMLMWYMSLNNREGRNLVSHSTEKQQMGQKIRTDSLCGQIVKKAMIIEVGKWLCTKHQMKWCFLYFVSRGQPGVRLSSHEVVPPIYKRNISSKLAKVFWSFTQETTVKITVKRTAFTCIRYTNLLIRLLAQPLCSWCHLLVCTWYLASYLLSWQQVVPGCNQWHSRCIW